MWVLSLQLLHISICLHRMEWRIFWNYIQENIFIVVDYGRKNILVKHCFRKKKIIFFFLERLSNKAGALGKNISAGFAESNGKSTLFYYHFKPFKNFSMKGKKKIQTLLAYSSGNSLVKADQQRLSLVSLPLSSLLKGLSWSWKHRKETSGLHFLITFQSSERFS